MSDDDQGLPSLGTEPHEPINLLTAEEEVDLEQAFRNFMRMNDRPTWTALPSEYEALYLGKTDATCATIKAALNNQCLRKVQCDRCAKMQWAVVFYRVADNHFMIIHPSGATSLLRDNGTREDVCMTCAPQNSERIFESSKDKVSDFFAGY